MLTKIFYIAVSDAVTANCHQNILISTVHHTENIEWKHSLQAVGYG